MAETIPHEQAAFLELLACTEDISKLVANTMDTDATFRAKYTKNLVPSLISAAHETARAIARDILEHEEQADTDGMLVDVASHEHLVSAAASQEERDRRMGIKRKCYT